MYLDTEIQNRQTPSLQHLENPTGVLRDCLSDSKRINV